MESHHTPHAQRPVHAAPETGLPTGTRADVAVTRQQEVQASPERLGLKATSSARAAEELSPGVLLAREPTSKCL